MFTLELALVLNFTRKQSGKSGLQDHNVFNVITVTFVTSDIQEI